MKANFPIDDLVKCSFVIITLENFRTLENRLCNTSVVHLLVRNIWIMTLTLMSYDNFV